MSALVSRVGVSRHLVVEVRLAGQPWESKKPRSRGIDLGFLLRALGGIRTPNLLIRSQMLYPLSYERRPIGRVNSSAKGRR